MQAKLNVNGETMTVDVEADSVLLWVIRDHLGLTGTKFGCGAGLCGACMVHIDGERAFSCQVAVADAVGHRVTTIEGLSTAGDHPVQKAWLDEQAPQCGYCQPGQIMNAVDLLSKNKAPTRAEIIEHMNTNICRCGAYPAILRAIELAAHRMQTDSDAS